MLFVYGFVKFSVAECSFCVSLPVCIKLAAIGLVYDFIYLHAQLPVYH